MAECLTFGERLTHGLLFPPIPVIHEKIFRRPFLSGLLNYNSLMLNGYGRVTQSHSSELALSLTALILGLACQQGSTSEDQAASSRDKPNNETTSR